MARLDEPAIYSADAGVETSSSRLTADERLKRCHGCGLIYAVVIGTTFNVKRAAPDGLQPFCLACDSRQKSEIPKGYARLLAALDGTPHAATWTRRIYLALFAAGDGLGGRPRGDGCCHWCGGRVNAWTRARKADTPSRNSSGYWLDRLSNDRVDDLKAYFPENCAPCCTPCNFERGNKPVSEWIPIVTPLIADYGWGRVAWPDARKAAGYTRATPPDLTAYRRDQPTLPGLVVAARGRP